MRIEYVHASRFGNGEMVANEFKRQMAGREVFVDVHHVRDVEPDRMPNADLYLFSSPGRMGKPTRTMRRFLRQVRLPAGTRFALLTTEMEPQPDKKTGRVPTEAELARWQRVRPIMKEILASKGLVEVAEEVVHVTAMKGPLEQGWQEKVAAYAAGLPVGASA